MRGKLLLERILYKGGNYMSEINLIIDRIVSQSVNSQISEEAIMNMSSSLSAYKLNKQGDNIQP